MSKTVTIYNIYGEIWITWRKSIQVPACDTVMGKERRADSPCLPALFTVCFSPSFSFSSLNPGFISSFFLASVSCDPLLSRSKQKNALVLKRLLSPRKNCRLDCLFSIPEVDIFHMACLNTYNTIQNPNEILIKTTRTENNLAIRVTSNMLSNLYLLIKCERNPSCQMWHLLDIEARRCKLLLVSRRCISKIHKCPYASSSSSIPSIADIKN